MPGPSSATRSNTTPSEAPPRAQIYKLADDFTFSGSEETFSQLQASLEGLEARGATPSPPELSCVAGD